MTCATYPINQNCYTIGDIKMSSYSYVNGCYSVTTEIRAGWKRLYKCNAQVQHLISQDGNTEHWNLISYATPICRVTRHVIDNESVYRVDLSHDWNCSVSTQRQLAKFFAMYSLPCSNYWCKELETLYTHNAITDIHYDYFDIVHDCELVFVDNDTLLKWMLSNGSRNNSFPMNICND